MKDKWWEDRAAELQAAADRKDTKAFYCGIKAIYGPTSRGSTPLYAADGTTLIKDQEGILRRWADHFESVLNRPSSMSDEAISKLEQKPMHHELDIPPSVNETSRAIKQLSKGKAAGSDGIPAEVYQCAGLPLAQSLARLFEAIWLHGTVPQDFKDALIVHLYKNKGNRHHCDNHRGISLLSIAGKVLSKIIINRLTSTVVDDIIPESQCGFRSSRSTTDMLFAARQVQEKCREQNRDLFMVFIDLTKAFDSVNREGLWKVLGKAGCPPTIVQVIRSFHDGMVGRVVDDGCFSAPFEVSNGTKQGCVMAPLLFSIVFSAVLQDAFAECDAGVKIRFRTDGSIFNLRRLKAKTKTSSMLLRELLYADDCALIAHSLEEVQLMVDAFSRATTRFGLTISIQKTEVLHQPRPGTIPTVDTVLVHDEPLKSVDKFCYLGGTISQNARIDDEVVARISKASSAFGRLQHRVWSDHGIRLSTKIQVYRAVVLSTLLYGCESWTPYRAHIKKLEQFHQRCLRKICGITWMDRVPNTEVLKKCSIPSIECLTTQSQLRWSGHVARMTEERIPKALLFGELHNGRRFCGGQQKRYKDVLKVSLKAYNIAPESWEQRAQDRSEWRKACKEGARVFESRRTAELEAKRQRRHDARAAGTRNRPPQQQPPPPPSTTSTHSFVCDDCGRVCASRIGLSSHRRHRH